MHFANPQFFWTLLIIPFVFFIFLYGFKKRHRQLQGIIQAHLWNEVIPDLKSTRRKLKTILMLVGLSLLILSLLGPQWGYTLQEIKKRGVDIFVLFDTSRSMLAEDFKPNRLERARRELYDLLSLLGGDRIGLIPFAGVSYVACPLTTDYQAFGLFMDQLDPELIPIQGTNIFHALETAIKHFDNPNTSKAILLITDGEITEGDQNQMVEVMKKNKIAVYIMGMGLPEGVPIPLDKEKGFKKDSQGNVVFSQLNEKLLQDLAHQTGGAYVRSVTGDLDLEQIYLKGIKKNLEDVDFDSQKRELPIHRYQIPLLAGLLLLGLELKLGELKKTKT